MINNHDNIGSVRLVVHSAGDRKQFDYKHSWIFSQEGS